MSERDTVHKEIEKLQEEIKEKNKKLATQDGRHKHHEEEVYRTPSLFPKTTLYSGSHDYIF